MQNNTNAPIRVLISGGGTGGHIFPALSIADAVRRRHPQADILFVGADNRMEMERVPAAGYRIEGLPVAGFDRHRPWRNIAVMFKLLRSLIKARKIVRDFKPDIAVGVGGYASGPTLKAAQRKGIPTLLQEQNSYAGVTNKLLAKKARRICTAYEGMERFFPEESIVLTGNPVRKKLGECKLTPSQAKGSLGFDPSVPLVLIVGGSLGAHTLNRVMLNVLEQGSADGSFNVLWQTGKNDAHACAAAVAAQNPQWLKQSDFISDMATAYRAADLVVARAGAGTISELEMLGKAAVLVPSPNVAEDHQRHNAEALVNRNAAVMVTDADAPAKLWNEISQLVAAPERREQLSHNILKLAKNNSDELIADEIDRIVFSK